MEIRIAIGADHRGYLLKNFITSQSTIGSFSIEWEDVGTFNNERTDYPLFARKVVQLMQDKWVDVGIMSCGSGIGMAVAANRFRGIYSGVAWNETVARMAKEDDNINVLVLPADYVTLKDGFDIVHAWLEATFKGGRYQDRLTMVDDMQTESCLNI